MDESSVAGRTAFLSAIVALGSVRCVSDFVSSPATNQAAASVVIAPPGPDTLTALGDARSYSAQAKDSSGNPIPNPSFTWSSSSSDVATVSGNGQASASGNGTTTIKATVQGVTGSVTLVVRQAANSASIAPGTFTLALLGSQALAASAIDANGNPVTRPLAWSWQTSNSLAVTVTPDPNDNSKATASRSAPGAVTITATTGGKSGTATAN